MSKKKIVFLIILVISILSVIFTYNDDFLYSKEIMRITDIKIKKEDESQNSLGLVEKYYYNNITGIITNGKNKGMKKTIQYKESYSSVVTDKYKVFDKVFIDSNKLDGLKRDTYVVGLIAIFIISIFLVGEYKGLLSVVSVIVNSIIFYFGLELYSKGWNIVLVCIIETVIFSVLSLVIAGGINPKTKSAIISVISCISILLVGLLIMYKTTNFRGINFNSMNYLMVPPETIFLSELIIGSLGAIMDVAITISSSVSELIEKDNNISSRNIKKSTKQIGKDIMSTMSNVLFFTYLCGGLPVFVLAIRNGFTMYNYISTNFTLELTRFLIGSIGIILTIPISTFISVRIFKRGDKVE